MFSIAITAWLANVLSTSTLLVRERAGHQTYDLESYADRRLAAHHRHYGDCAIASRQRVAAAFRQSQAAHSPRLGMSTTLPSSMATPFM